MKKTKKKTNSDRDAGIVWCMKEIHLIRICLKALQKQINELGDSHKEKTT